MFNDRKVRIRKEYELENQHKGLVEIRDILNGLNIEYFIGGGTLLGIVRDGDFIPWDWDAHINLKTEDVFDKKEQMIESFIDKGFSVAKRDFSRENFKIVLTKYNTDYELMGWFIEGSLRHRRHYKLPDKFFKNPSKKKLRGELYTCMSLSEEYLKYKYGEWQKPLRTCNKNKYLSSDFHKKPKIKRIFEENIKRVKNIMKKLKSTFQSLCSKKK